MIFSSKLNKEYFSGNDFNEANYTRILADAFEEGPLKRYYLFCEKEFYEGRFPETEEEGKRKKRVVVKYPDSSLVIDSKLKAEKRAMHVNNVLKITACYLLHNGSYTNKRIFNQTYFLNWIKCDKNTLERYYFGDKKLYQKKPISGNITTISMPEEWAKHFKLVEEGEFDREYDENKWVFWSDTGSRKDPLGFGKKYSIRIARNPKPRG